MILNPHLLYRGLRAGDPAALASVFLLLIFNEIGLPLPIVYESLLLFAGFRLSHGEFRYLATAAFGSLGSTLGASLVFFVFYIFGAAILRTRFFKNRKEKIDLLKGELSRREVLAVALSRLTPGLVGLTGVAAGILRLSYLKFALGVFLSNLVWAVVLISAGFALGKSYPRTEAFSTFGGKISLVLSLSALLLFFFVLKRMIDKIKKVNRETPPYENTGR